MTLKPVRKPLLNRAFNGRAMRNVSGTQSVDPLRVFDASELADLVELVRRAGADGTTVRAVGSRHPWSDVALGGGYVLRPKRHTGALELDHVREGVDTARLLRIRAGTRIRELNELLDSRGLALANMGGYDGQTFAGVMSTATHGTGVAYGPLASFARSIDLVAAGGVVYRIEPEGGITDALAYSAAHPEHRIEQNDDVFAAVLVSMGLLGVLHSVTIEAVDAFRLLEKRVLRRWSEVRAEIADPGYLGGFDHYELYLSPYGDGDDNPCMVCTRTPTDEPQPPWWSKRARRSLSPEILALIPGIGRVLNVAAGLAPRAVPRMIRMTLGALADDEYVNKSYRVFNIGRANHVPAYSAEIGVPVDERGLHLDAIERIFAIAGRHARLGDVYQTSPLALRFVAPSDAPMAMMHGRRTMMIELIMLKRTQGGMELLADYEDALYELEGRPHWGQVNTLTPGRVRELYPGLDAWLQVHDWLNAGGVFDSAFSKRAGIRRVDRAGVQPATRRPWP
jgi:L-gulono-1,4-lactone dehydrogenase